MFGRDIQWLALRVGTRSAFFPLFFKPLNNPIMPNTYHNALTGHLSYYGLSLLSYLRESHPDLAADTAFIATRAAAAAQVYSEAIRCGRTHPEAGEEAVVVLFQDLHFSLYDTLVAVLREEFADAIPEEDVREAARVMLPLVRTLGAKYVLSDDFASTPEYDQLYTEVVGTVQILLHDGLQ